MFNVGMFICSYLCVKFDSILIAYSLGENCDFSGLILGEHTESIWHGVFLVG